MDSIFQIFTAFGTATLLGGFVYIGRKLQILDDLKISMDKVKHNIQVIANHLTKYDARFDVSELKAMSPYQLTEKGKELITTIGFDKVFEEHKKEFFSWIDSEEPKLKLKYDVEIASIKAIHVFEDKSYMKFLKIFLYNNPARRMENIAPTLGVYVRDQYFIEHPEIVE